MDVLTEDRFVLGLSVRVSVTRPSADAPSEPTVRALVQESVRSFAAQAPIGDVIEDRARYAEGLQDSVVARLDAGEVPVLSVELTDVALPPEVAHAVRHKQRLEQERLRLENERRAMEEAQQRGEARWRRTWSKIRASLPGGQPVPPIPATSGECGSNDTSQVVGWGG